MCKVVLHQQWQNTAAAGSVTTNFRTSNPLKQMLLQWSVSPGIELVSNNVNREVGMVSVIKNSHSLPVIVEEAYPGFFNFYNLFQGPKLACSFIPNLFTTPITW
jgi:hypothetical protein